MSLNKEIGFGGILGLVEEFKKLPEESQEKILKEEFGSIFSEKNGSKYKVKRLTKSEIRTTIGLNRTRISSNATRDDGSRSQVG